MITSLGCGLVDLAGRLMAPTETVAPTALPAPTETRTPVPVATEAEPTPTATSTPEPQEEVATPEPEADTVSLEVVNETGQDIWYLFVAPSQEDMWGDDRLGDEIFMAGDTTVVEGLPPGMYDVQALTEDETIIETVWEVDLTQASSLTLSGEAALEVNNLTDVTIEALYISAVDAETWGDNALSEAIPAGASTTVEGIPSGWYDLRTVDTTGETVEAVFDIELIGDNFWDVVGKAALPDNATLRFEDTFDDNRNSWGETRSEDVNYQAPTDGTYCIEINVDQLTAWEWYEPFRTDEFVAEVACQIEEEADATCGLGFGPDGDNLYWFEVSPFDQMYRLRFLRDDEWQDPLIDWTVSKNISNIPEVGWNTLSMERIGDTLSIYANGIWLTDVEESTLDTGRVGLGGATYENPGVTVCLDNLRVWELD